MGVLPSIKISFFLSTCAFISKISTLKLNGVFQHQHTEKGLVMELVAWIWQYENQILNEWLQLNKWVAESISAINFTFVIQEEYEESETFLKERFNQAVTIQGTQQ